MKKTSHKNTQKDIPVGQDATETGDTRQQERPQPSALVFSAGHDGIDASDSAKNPQKKSAESNTLATDEGENLDFRNLSEGDHGQPHVPETSSTRNSLILKDAYIPPKGKGEFVVRQKTVDTAVDDVDNAPPQSVTRGVRVATIHKGAKKSPAGAADRTLHRKAPNDRDVQRPRPWHAEEERAASSPSSVVESSNSQDDVREQKSAHDVIEAADSAKSQEVPMEQTQNLSVHQAPQHTRTDRIANFLRKPSAQIQNPTAPSLDMRRSPVPHPEQASHKRFVNPHDMHAQATDSEAQTVSSSPFMSSSNSYGATENLAGTSAQRSKNVSGSVHARRPSNTQKTGALDSWITKNPTIPPSSGPVFAVDSTQRSVQSYSAHQPANHGNNPPDIQEAISHVEASKGSQTKDRIPSSVAGSPDFQRSHPQEKKPDSAGKNLRTSPVLNSRMYSLLSLFIGLLGCTTFWMQNIAIIVAVIAGIGMIIGIVGVWSKMKKTAFLGLFLCLLATAGALTTELYGADLYRQRIEAFMPIVRQYNENVRDIFSAAPSVDQSSDSVEFTAVLEEETEEVTRVFQGDQYVDEDHGYSFALERGWSIQEEQSGEIHAIFYSDETVNVDGELFRPTITVAQYDFRADTVEDYVAQAEKDLEFSLENYSSELSQTQDSAYTVEGTYSTNELVMRRAAKYIRTESTIFVISFTCPEQVWMEYEPIAQEALSSFHVN
jgi:hypothetical protein